MTRVLYVDDEPGLLDIGRIFLEDMHEFSVDTDTGAEPALRRIVSGRYDAIISDYQMPGMDGISFLKAIRERAGDIPFILFTGRGREEVVIEAINNGADFYLQKGGDPEAQFAELAHKVKQAVSRHRAQNELKEAYERIAASEEELRSQLEELVDAQKERDRTEMNFRTLVDNAPEAIYIATTSYRFVYVNNAIVKLLGAASPEELLGTSTLDRIHPSFHERISRRVDDLTVALKPVGRLEEVYIRLDGTPVNVEVSAVPFLYQGEHAVLVMIRDITTRKQAENELMAAYEQIAAAEQELRRQYEKLVATQAELKKQQEQLTEVTEMVPGLVYQFYARTDGSRGLYYVSSRGREIFGFDGDIPDFFGWFTAHVDPEDRGVFLRSIDEVIRTKTPWNFEGRFIRPTGDRIWFQGMSRPVQRDSELVFNGIMFDISERKLAQISRRENGQK